MAHLLRLFGGSGGGGLVLSKISARPLFCGLRQRGHNSRQQSTDAASATAKGSFDGSVKSAGETADVVDRLRRSFGDVLACGGVVPVYKQALLYGNKIAIKDQFGEFSYAQLYTGAKKLASQITHLCAVPLSHGHPANLLDYYIKDSEATILITIAEFEQLLTPLANKHQRPLIVLDQLFIPAANTADQAAMWQDIQFDDHTSTVPRIVGTLNNSFYQTADAMILYTSGSTGTPKGAIITHKNIAAQTNALSSAWSITAADSLLHVLPLNHVHGSVNALLTPLSQGARITMLPKYDSTTTWATLLNVNLPSKDRITVFMAVPTIYSLLLAEYDKTFAKNGRMTEFIRAQCEKKIRLMISGSAPLPATVFQRWEDVTGHRLLERYGMTETGMVLSNPLIEDKVRARVPGSVGAPLAGVEVRLMSSDGKVLAREKGERGKGIWSDTDLPVYEQSDEQTAAAAGQVVGELCVRGDSVFAGYLNRPDETAAAFRDGWFLTGDEAACDANGTNWRILGRKNVDIIKAGGHKVSALQIETKLLEVPNVADVCVVGLPDETWGQQIAALIQIKQNVDEANCLATLKEFGDENLASYERPSIWKFIKQMPRNQMGKVNKKMVIVEHFGNAAEASASATSSSAAAAGAAPAGTPKEI